MDVLIENMDRYSIVDLLEGSDNVGIELGVAGGAFSARMMSSGKFSKGFGVDLYSDHHDLKEYKEAVNLVGLDVNYSLLRMSFDEALDLFPDNFFDFIYVDGYAHTGEQGGKTFFDWLPKLKEGGIMAGDDYDDNWPLVKEAVHYFVDQLGVELHVTDPEKIVSETVYDASPSWFIYNRNASSDLTRHAEMEARGVNISVQTQQNHEHQLKLGRVFVDLINDSVNKDQPVFVDFQQKRVFVIAKDK